jgi:hypothetical protein
MEAVVWTKHGPPEVLQLREVAKPAPKETEVLIRIHATTITAGDCEIRSLKFHVWLSLPMRIYAGVKKTQRVTILGQEFDTGTHLSGIYLYVTTVHLHLATPYPIALLSMQTTDGRGCPTNPSENRRETRFWGAVSKERFILFTPPYVGRPGGSPLRLGGKYIFFPLFGQPPKIGAPRIFGWVLNDG